MDLELRIRMNEKLYVRNPEDSVLGKKIVKVGLALINRIGFEDFTFKKLAFEVNTTEATIYRYFENKHKLLLYFITWYWSILDYKVVYSINNIQNTDQKLRNIVKILCEVPNNKPTDFLSEFEAHRVVICEGSKAYLTRDVNKDNKDRLFKPYKDLCERISQIIKEHNPKYEFPHSLATTILEMSHTQLFFKENLPRLTDFPKEKDNDRMRLFLETLLFAAIKK